ncbi:hypothetical protein BFJ68_g16339 [Fusarium oxysporum]|uniref:Uncharacterized protein n=1 Tax=Fusarium oxysporum TaxID=5507 RepID=A0A420PEJ4_FUSOX|nr:hypothetical protein BFJ68_g16339 [Fusarium oxysporum]
MVEYAEQGNDLRTHRDVPPYILDMIYEKERLDGERRAKRKAPSSESDRPIKIMNVLPSPHGQTTAEGCTRPDKEQFHLSDSDESAFNATLMWIL